MATRFEPDQREIFASRAGGAVVKSRATEWTAPMTT